MNHDAHPATTPVKLVFQFANGLNENIVDTSFESEYSVRIRVFKSYD